MGVKITDLFKGKEIELEDLSGKTIAIDSYLFLYQFLTTIRQRDGSLLMDSKGRKIPVGVRFGGRGAGRILISEF